MGVTGLPIGRMSGVQVVLAAGGLLGVILAGMKFQALDEAYFDLGGIILFFMPVGAAAWIERRARRKPDHPKPHLGTWLFLGPLLITLVLLANGALDFSPPQRKVLVVTKKWASQGSRSGTHYNVEFDSWRGPGMERIEVNREAFAAIQTGQPMTLDSHRGLFGITWVSGVRAVQPESVGQ